MALVGGRRKIDARDEVAAWDQRDALTWRELDSLLNRATNALIAQGLDPETQRVAVFAENSVETAVGHLCGALAGVSTVPVNFHLTAAELEYILKDSGTAILLVGPETAEVGLEAAAAAGGVTVVGWRCVQADDRLTSWDDFLLAGEDKEPPTDMAPRPYLHYTSGTTGRPKAAEAPPTMRVGGSTIAEYFDLLLARPAEPGTTCLVVSPMYHGAGLNYVLALGGGSKVVILGRFDAERTLWAIDHHKITTTMMVPTHFARLLALPEETRARYDMSSLRMVGHTGASCPVNVKRRLIEWFGPVLFEVYGATEAGGTNSISSAEWLEYPGSVGRTMPPFELLVIGDDGQELEPGEVGQLYFRDTKGRGVVYHNDPAKTAEAHLSPGVFTLGDVGYVNEQGYVFITDRSSDMVVSGGANIYPAEAEQALIEHPGVADVACIGVPNTDLGEELKALVVPVDIHQAPAVDELIAFCRARLAGYKCPKSVDIVTTIGRNAMGKVNKRALRAPFWPTERTIG